MGQTLSEPVTEKHTTVVVRGKQYWVGLSDMQGWRISMEDAHSVHLYMPSPKSSSAPIEPSSETIPEQPTGSTVTNNSPDNQDGNALFGVFDGHGGSTVAKFAGTTLHKRLSDSDAYKSGDYDKALKETFLKTDEDLRADASFFNDPSGCTAVVGLLTQDGRIIVANSGDSRSVLGYKGEAKAMSHDHKPTNKEETARITSAGGFVEFGRVNGNLALSRALGDFEFKQNHSLEPEKQIVTADPDIITHKIDGEEEFLVLACDGIWDCLTSQQVIDFTRRAIANGDDLGKICEDMMKKCTATESDTGGIGCDNMTVIVVALLNGRTPEEWQQWVKERVEKKHGYDTPASVPDIFGQTQGRGLTGGVTGGMGIGGGAGGFRVAGAGGLANIASILGASGITFKPSDDSDEDEDDEDDLQIIGDESQSDVPESKIKEINQNSYIDDKGLKGDTKPADVTDKLDSTSALDTDSQSGSVRLVDEDGDSTMDSGDDSDETTTGEPSAPAKSSGTKTPNFTSVGSPNVPPHKELLPLDGKIGGGKQSNKDRLNDSSDQKQFETVPLGDEPSAAVGTEGLMDTSENPTKM